MTHRNDIQHLIGHSRPRVAPISAEDYFRDAITAAWAAFLFLQRCAAGSQIPVTMMALVATPHDIAAWARRQHVGHHYSHHLRALHVDFRAPRDRR